MERIVSSDSAFATSVESRGGQTSRRPVRLGRLGGLLGVVVPPDDPWYATGTRLPLGRRPLSFRRRQPERGLGRRRSHRCRRTHRG